MVRVSKAELIQWLVESEERITRIEKSVTKKQWGVIKRISDKIMANMEAGELSKAGDLIVKLAELTYDLENIIKGRAHYDNN